MRPKLLSLLIVLSMVLATFGTAFAQERLTGMPAPFCGDLAEEDCALIEASQEAMLEVANYKATGTYQAMVSGLPGLPADEVAAGVQVDGSFAADEAGLAAAVTLATIPPEDVALATMEDPQLLVDLASGVDAAVTLSVAMTPELADVLTAEAGGLPVPAELSLNMVLLDGIFYIDLSPLAAYGAVDGWVGLPLADYLVAVGETGYYEQRAAALAAADPQTAAALAVQGALMDPTLYQSGMAITRGEDVEVEGETAATFTTTYDLGAWLTSPDFAAFVQSLVDSGAVSEADAAQLDEVMQMLPMIAPMLFQGLVIESMQVIGVDSALLYDSTFDLAWDLAGLFQMAAMTGQLPPEIDPNAPAAIGVNTEVVNFDIGGEQEIVAPEDAAMFTVEQLMPAAQ